MDSPTSRTESSMSMPASPQAEADPNNSSSSSLTAITDSMSLLSLLDVPSPRQTVGSTSKVGLGKGQVPGMVALRVGQFSEMPPSPDLFSPAVAECGEDESQSDADDLFCGFSALFAEQELEDEDGNEHRFHDSEEDEEGVENLTAPSRSPSACSCEYLCFGTFRWNDDPETYRIVKVTGNDVDALLAHLVQIFLKPQPSPPFTPPSALSISIDLHICDTPMCTATVESLTSEPEESSGNSKPLPTSPNVSSAVIPVNHLPAEGTPSALPQESEPAKKTVVNIVDPAYIRPVAPPGPLSSLLTPPQPSGRSPLTRHELRTVIMDDGGQALRRPLFPAVKTQDTRIEDAQVEAVQGNAVQDEAVQDEAGQDEAVQDEAGQDEAGQDEAGQVEDAPVEATQVEAVQVDRLQVSAHTIQEATTLENTATPPSGIEQPESSVQTHIVVPDFIPNPRIAMLEKQSQLFKEKAELECVAAAKMMRGHRVLDRAIASLEEQKEVNEMELYRCKVKIFWFSMWRFWLWLQMSWWKAVEYATTWTSWFLGFGRRCMSEVDKAVLEDDLWTFGKKVLIVEGLGIVFLLGIILFNHWWWPEM